jgi:tetratricopeptide (TPR) repeat protein
MPPESPRDTSRQPNAPDGWPEAATHSRRPRTGRWLGRLVIVVVIFLALGPVLSLETPAEIARWYQAAAMEHWIAGDKPQALEHLETALRWAPTRAEAFVCRGDWRLDEQQFQQAIDDYNSALQLEPRHVTALINRSLAYQHLGLHQQAIQDWKKLLELHGAASGPQRAMLLNGLAYAQALGNVELKEALENIIQAINLVGENPAMLDTRGYIHFLRGNFEAANTDLDAAVTGMERELGVLERTRQYIDHAEFEQQLAEHRHSLAVLRYHRALILEALDRPWQAEADLRRVQELGHTPGPELF